MIGHLQAIRDKLVTDVRSSWSIGSTTPVALGRPHKPITVYPHAVVTTREVQRQRVGPRSVGEEYVFEITGVFAIPSGSQVINDLQITKAAALGDVLTPPLTDSGSGLTAPARYGTYGQGQFVSSIEFPDIEDDDTTYQVTLVFQCGDYNHE